MWTRELLKTNAKQALQGRYWRSFWICLVLSFVGLGGAGANSGSAAHQAVSTVTDDTTAYDIVNSIPDSMLGAIFVGMLIGSIAALCWALFVVYPLNVGRCRYFMESRQSLTPVSTVVSTFRRPYGNPIVVQLLTDLKIALGFLLLIVPGIYWEYCYELVPYLLAENPYMSATRAMELSKEMMEARSGTSSSSSCPSLAGCCSACSPSASAASFWNRTCRRPTRNFTPPCAARHWPWA